MATFHSEGPHTVHAPNLRDARLRLPKMNAGQKDKAAKPKAEPKPKQPGEETQGRSGHFGDGAGEHGQGTVINHHYHNVGNVIHGDNSGTAYGVGKGSINIGEGAAPPASPTGPAARNPRAPRAPRAKRVVPTQKATAERTDGGATPELAPKQSRTPRGAVGSGPLGVAAAAADAEGRKYTVVPPGMPGTPPTKKKPLALGAAPVKTEPAPAAPGEGSVIPGEVVKDEPAPTTKSKPATKRKMQPVTFTPRSEGGTVAGRKPTDSNVQFQNVEDRINSGADSPVTKLVAAAALKTATRKPNVVSELAQRTAKVRPADDAVPMPKAAAPSPASATVVGSASGQFAVGDSGNPHVATRVTHGGRRAQIPGNVIPGHHVKIDGAVRRVNQPVKGTTDTYTIHP